MIEVLQNNSSTKAMKANAKTLIHEKHQAYHWDHVTNLAVQGEYCRIWDIQESDFSWKSIMYNLPRGVTKFLLNSVFKTLPTKDNLSKWGKVISQECDLCGDRETTGHALSGCKVMLDQGRYTWCHDSILSKISTSMHNHLNEDTQLHTDLNSP